MIRKCDVERALMPELLVIIKQCPGTLKYLHEVLSNRGRTVQGLDGRDLVRQALQRLRRDKKVCFGEDRLWEVLP
jgi:hypothetical protein